MSPKIRQTLYLLGTLATSAVALAVTWNLVDQATAASVQQLVAAGLSFLGPIATATAAVAVGKQRKEGQFDALAPADSVINGVQVLLEQSASAQQEVEKVKKALNDAIGQVPVLGPLSKQILDGFKI